MKAATSWEINPGKATGCTAGSFSAVNGPGSAGPVWFELHMHMSCDEFEPWQGMSPCWDFWW